MACLSAPKRRAVGGDRSDLQLFAEAAERLMSSGLGIPADAICLCERMLKCARRHATEQPAVIPRALCERRGLSAAIESFVDCKCMWQWAATSRCFHDVFADRVRGEQRWLQDLSGKYGPVPVRLSDFTEPRDEETPHAPFLVQILNGQVDDVGFMLQLGINVNSKESEPVGVPPSIRVRSCIECDLCIESECWLPELTYWEVAFVMANSRSPSRRRRAVRDLLRRYGGFSRREDRLPTKRQLVSHLYGQWGYGDARCRLSESNAVEDSDWPYAD